MKILGLVGCCASCPNYGYYSGGQYECKAVFQPITDKQGIPAWCPLPNHPAEAMVQMERTITDLRSKLAEKAVRHD